MWMLKATVALLAVASCIALPRDIWNYNTNHLSGRQTGTPGRAVRGGYSWTAPNGQQVTINYIADNQGYRIVNSQAAEPSFPKPSTLPKLPSRSKPLAKTSPVFPPPAARPTFAKKPDFSHRSAPSTFQNNFAAPARKSSGVHSHFSVGSPKKTQQTSFATRHHFSMPAQKPSPASSHFGNSHFQIRTQSHPTTARRTTTTTTTTQKPTTARPITVIFFTSPKTTTMTKTTTEAPAVAATKPFEQKVFHPSQKISTAKAVSPSALTPKKVNSVGSVAMGSETETIAATGTAEKSAKSVAAPETKSATTPAETEVTGTAEGKEATASEGTETTATEGTEAGAAEEAGAEGEEAEAEGGEAEGGEGEAEGGENEGGEAEEAEGEEEEEAYEYEYDYEEYENESEDSNSEAEDW